MSEFIGLALLGIGLVLLAAAATWFQKYDKNDSALWMMFEDLVALGVSAFIVAGVATVVGTIAVAWTSGNFLHVVISLVAVVAFFVGTRYLMRRRQTA